MLRKSKNKQAKENLDHHDPELKKSRELALKSIDKLGESVSFQLAMTELLRISEKERQ